jgi:hypothetical protein
MTEKRRNPESFDCLVAPPSMQKIVTIYSSDWHLSARDADQYRWNIFSFLAKLIKDRGARYLMFCGDLCEDKDQHPFEFGINPRYNTRIGCRSLASSLSNSSCSYQETTMSKRIVRIRLNPETVTYKQLEGYSGYRFGDDGSVWCCFIKVAAGAGSGQGASRRVLGPTWKKFKSPSGRTLVIKT